MQLEDTWIWYCSERLGDSAENAAPVPVSPLQAMELLWTFGPMFTAREAIGSTPYDTAFDGEADLALTHMSQTDCFDSWDRLSAGAWRVLKERWLYAMMVASLNEAKEVEVIGGLPEGLDRQSQERALLLMFLLGGARTIDRRLLPERSGRSLPLFPSGTMLRRQ